MDIIKEDIFRKQLKTGLNGGYLFFGEEDYLKGFSLRSARQSICGDETCAVFNDISITPLDYSPSALMSALMPPPMMSDKKIVTVNGLAISAMKQNELDDLFEVLAILPDYDYNVLIISVPAGMIDEGNLPKRPSPVLTEFSKYLTPVKFDPVTGARLVNWVGKHFSHHGVNAQPEVCELLISKCGNSMFTLSSEAEKLSYYILEHNRTEVKRDDVENVSISVVSSDAYALANAILDGKYPTAMEALNVMKFRRVDPIIIMSEVSRVVCDLVSVKAMQDDGMSVTEIAASLKMNEYKTKLYAAAAATKARERLKRALTLCSDADIALKSSMQGYAVIEKLICTL